MEPEEFDEEEDERRCEVCDSRHSNHGSCVVCEVELPECMAEDDHCKSCHERYCGDGGDCGWTCECCGLKLCAFCFNCYIPCGTPKEDALLKSRLEGTSYEFHSTSLFNPARSRRDEPEARHVCFLCKCGCRQSSCFDINGWVGILHLHERMCPFLSAALRVVERWIVRKRMVASGTLCDACCHLARKRFSGSLALLLPLLPSEAAENCARLQYLPFAQFSVAPPHLRKSWV
jgi:hypothetical protein